MRRALLFRNLSVLFSLATTLAATAQADRFAYAVTDVSKDGAGWNAIRKLDLQTGTYSDIIFNGTDAKIVAYDAATKKQVDFSKDARYGSVMQSPFSTGVAAAAFDKKHNRLYFTPMFIDQLRYIDLSTMKMYCVTDKAFTNLGTLHNDEGKIVTRMVIAPDGNGYAITNDGNTLIQFSTAKKGGIKQLGALVDDPANNGVSIHNRCSSFGGDMISDDAGNLYILTARNHVFKVSTQTKVATHLGVVSGLPEKFTTNGAVVDADGALLVSSAVDNSAYYVVNPSNWQATAYNMPAGVFRSSDLANSNYLATSKTTSIETIADRRGIYSNFIQVYPNPVTTGRFAVQFNKVPYGDYQMEVTDVMGRSILQRKLTINLDAQTQEVPIGRNNAKGIYLLRILDGKQTSVFEQKLMLQ